MVTSDYCLICELLRFLLRCVKSLHGVSAGALLKVGLMFTDSNVTGSLPTTLISIAQALRIQCLYYFNVDRAGMTQK